MIKHPHNQTISSNLLMTHPVKSTEVNFWSCQQIWRLILYLETSSFKLQHHNRGHNLDSESCWSNIFRRNRKPDASDPL
jgi:hypothetical protein